MGHMFVTFSVNDNLNFFRTLQVILNLAVVKRFWPIHSRSRWGKFMDTWITWILANIAWILPKFAGHSLS